MGIFNSLTLLIVWIIKILVGEGGFMTTASLNHYSMKNGFKTREDITRQTLTKWLIMN